jgi:hypothetical protein
MTFLRNGAASMTYSPPSFVISMKSRAMLLSGRKSVCSNRISPSSTTGRRDRIYVLRARSTVNSMTKGEWSNSPGGALSLTKGAVIENACNRSARLVVSGQESKLPRIESILEAQPEQELPRALAQCLEFGADLQYLGEILAYRGAGQMSA